LTKSFNDCKIVNTDDTLKIVKNDLYQNTMYVGVVFTMPTEASVPFIIGLNEMINDIKNIPLLVTEEG
jgi:hypothetical protein